MNAPPVDTAVVPDLDPHTLRSAFGAFPSGVVAVAAQVRGHLTGIAASSFTSVSLDPPLVSFSVATTSNTWPLLREAGHLGVSVLADHHDAVCRQLAGPTEQRFTGLPFRSTVRRCRPARRGRRDVRLHDPPGDRGRRPPDRACSTSTG